MEKYTNSEENDIYSVSDRRTNTETTNTESENDNNDEIFLEKDLPTHPVVNTRNKNSSSDSQKKNLTDINFNNNENKFETFFYNLERLKKKSFTEIYNLLNESQMIIFIDNYKIEDDEPKSKCFGKCKLKIKDDKFPGCTFFAYEYINTLKIHIHKLNNYILKAELKNQKI